MKLRSPCVALSGHGDNFDSIFNLCGCVRDGVFLEKAVIRHPGMGGGMGYSIEMLTTTISISTGKSRLSKQRTGSDVARSEPS